MLALEPTLVHLERADAGSLAPARFEAVRQGWVEITRPWHLLTTNSGAGDPRSASAEKGRAAFEIVAERIAGFLVELAQAPVDESFPLGLHPNRTSR
jgi:creatinine amidohydrolase